RGRDPDAAGRERARAARARRAGVRARPRRHRGRARAPAVRLAAGRRRGGRAPAIEQGVPAAQAAESYRPPAALGEWVMFSQAYWRVAFQAWERELRGTNP